MLLPLVIHCIFSLECGGIIDSYLQDSDAVRATYLPDLWPGWDRQTLLQGVRRSNGYHFGISVFSIQVYLLQTIKLYLHGRLSSMIILGSDGITGAGTRPIACSDFRQASFYVKY